MLVKTLKTFQVNQYKNFILILVLFIPISCSLSPTNTVNVSMRVKHGELMIEYDDQLFSKILWADQSTKPLTKKFTPSEYIETENSKVSRFKFKSRSEKVISDELGKGKQVKLLGVSSEGIQKTVLLNLYDDFQSLIIQKVIYTNLSNKNIAIEKWVNHAYELVSVPEQSNTQQDAPFWSYQGASYEDRRDWLLPLTDGFEQQNYMGMNATDYGSGTPIIDVWRKDIGVAIGHIEITPKLVSLPIKRKVGSDSVNIHIELEKRKVLPPDGTFESLTTFVTLHQGDYYKSLKRYRNIMALKGLKAPEFKDSSYEPIWCAWGYERGFNVDDVLGTLEKAKSLGLKWAVLDDGWQTAEGDWYLNPDKFPAGDVDMKKFVKKINKAGLKAKLWWAPLAVDPGTDLIKDHSDMLLLDINQKPVDITWWDSYYLCPAYDKTIEYSNNLVKKIIGDWGYAGLKIDGQHLNGVPRCYNKKHHHKYPEESVEKLQDFWKSIYKTAISLNSDTVVEICPCGTSYAFHNTPYMNQSVSSDPLSSWQIRSKGKTMKGLTGDSAPYYGDHVELSDNANDFASSVGIGAVIGTKFTWSTDKNPQLGFFLDKKKEDIWRRWSNIYKNKMLPKGKYLGEYYDIAFDKPETHLIEKDGRLYYAFYADKWKGEIELRGLKKLKYKIVDYKNNLSLGVVSRESPYFNFNFERYQLIELIPEDD